MATILQMIENRLPDESEIFSGSLGSFSEEAQALAGYECLSEEDLTTLQKSLIADMAAKALILPAMSKYKKDLAKAEGEGAGTAEFVDKLKFLKEMQAKLATDIAEKRAKIEAVTDTGVPMQVVE
ncbi:MAG: hypothetical protein HY739_12950 [Desulfobacterales bacterium]|nr:hypothetical protein [Desulfobacterales bacterium]